MTQRKKECTINNKEQITKILIYKIWKEVSQLLIRTMKKANSKLGFSNKMDRLDLNLKCIITLTHSPVKNNKLIMRQLDTHLKMSWNNHKTLRNLYLLYKNKGTVNHLRKAKRLFILHNHKMQMIMINYLKCLNLNLMILNLNLLNQLMDNYYSQIMKLTLNYINW